MKSQWILLLFFYSFGFSQSNQFVLQQWNVEDGLPQSTVRCITQTVDGYIWAGTWNGLVRFDGVGMKTFNAANTPELLVSNVMSLCADRKGRLWIGTDAGGLAQYTNRKFFRLDSADGIQAARILSIHEDHAGRIWCATERGIYVYNEKKFLHFTEANGLPRTYANQTAVLPDGTMYLGFVGEGCIAYLNGDSLIIVENFSLGGFAVAADDSGTLWYGVRNKGFIKRKNGKEFIDRRFADVHPGETYYLQNGEKWLLTPNAVYAITDSAVTILEGVEGVKFSEITVVFQDREKNIWLGKEGDGLILLRKKKIITLSKLNGFPADIIMSGVQDTAGKIWIGTWDNGLLAGDYSSLKFHSVRLPQPVRSVYAVNKSQNGILWAGTWGNGLYSIQNGNVRLIENSLLSRSTSIISVAEDAKGNVWAGTAHDGAVCMTGNKATLWNTESGMSGNRINSILCTRNGDTWISVSANGVNRISNGMLTVYKKGSGLNDNFASPMYEDDDGNVWIGTNNGLTRWKNGKFSYVTVQQGLFDNVISQIIQDDSGNFWIGSVHGIYKVLKQELNDAADGKIASVNALVLGKEDGMLNEEMSGGGIHRSWKSSDGNLWFSSSKGVVIINPKTISVNEIPPAALLPNVLIDNVSVPFTDEVVLQPEQTKLEIEFSGINFSAPKKIRFHYLLDGLNDVWIDAGTKRFTQFTNLEPGAYLFRLKAQNNSGAWSENEAHLRIIILPKYYQTWWFRLLAVVLFFMLGPVIYYFRIKKLQKEKDEHVQFSRRLIESQEVERKRIATELHDGLGQSLLIIKNKLVVALQTIAKESPFALQVEEVSGIVSSTIDEVRSISHNLRPHQLDQLGITKTLRAVVRRANESTPIECTGSIADFDGMLSPEEEINLYRIVQEAFNNIIKHSEATAARLEAERNENVLSVSISDNGKGISSADGFGISGMQERAKMFHWKFTRSSEPGKGTTISLTITLQ